MADDMDTMILTLYAKMNTEQLERTLVKLQDQIDFVVIELNRRRKNMIK